MRSKILNNKKGIGIGDMVAIIIFFSVVILVVYFFNINENVKGKILSTDIQSQKDIVSGHEALVDYLREMDGSSTKADIIAKSILEKNYELAKKDMTQYFSKKLSGVEWYIDVKDSSQKLLFQIQSSSLVLGGDYTASGGVPYFITSIIVPIIGANYISIELFFVR